MTNAYKLGKKALSWGVVATTIAWSVGVASVAAPLAASAAVSLPSGSLIKGSLPAVYYLASNGKRYVFPSQKTYNTWYVDFSGVTTISDADLATMSIGGNVVHRAGTRLVKIQSDPKTYAVEPGGALRWVTAESVASALWGSTWGANIDDVSDAFFVNYHSGADLSSNTYPTGSLVKMTGASDVYYIDGTAKRKVTAAGFTANRFQDRFVRTTSLDLSVYTNGTDISTGEPALTDAAQLGTTGTTPPPSGSGLTLSLGTGNPAAATIVTDTVDGGQALIGGLKLHLTAAADGAVTVTTLKVRRGGISSDADMQEVYLYSGDSLNTELARSTSISSGVVTFTNASGLFTVPAGGSLDVMVRFDLATNVTAGKTISVSVEAADITSSSSSTSISGSAMGNTMTVASVTDLGQLEMVNIQPTAAGSVDPQTDYELWRFRFDANDQNLIIKWVKITNAGSVDNDDIQNFKLMDGTTQIGSTVPTVTGNLIVFDLSGMADGGLKLTSGQTKQLALRGDILGGTNRTFRFGIRNGNDVAAWDSNYSVYTRPVKDGQETFAVIEPNSSGTAVDTTISTGKLTIQTATDSPSTNVPDGATGVLVAKWTFTAAGEDVKVNNLTPNCSSGDSTTILKNIKLIFNGSQVGSTDASETCDGSGATEFTFGNSFVVPAGSTQNLEYVADLTDTTVATNDTLTANLTLGAANAEGRVSLVSISTTAASGRTLTVKSGALTTSEDASFTDRTSGNPTGVLGAQGVLIGQFVVTGGGEDADVTQVILTDNVTTNTLADTFQNLKLWLVKDDGTTQQIGSTFGTLTDTAATTYTFTPSAAIRVGAGATKVFKITADIKTAGTVITLDGVIYPSKVSATGVVTGSDVSDSDGTNAELQNVHILANGNLSIYPDSATPIKQTYVMGATVQELARFRFDASIEEDINITRIVISNVMSNGGAIDATGTLKNVKLVDATSGTQYGGTIASFSSGTDTSTIAPSVVFDNISNLTVTRSGSKVLKVVSDISTSLAGGVSSSTHQMVIAPNFFNSIVTGDNGTTAISNLSITATGRDSGYSISGGSLDFNANSTNSATDVVVQGSAMDVFRAKLTVAKASDAPSGVTSGASEQIVAKFVFTNTSPGDHGIVLSLMNLDVGSTISNTAARNMKVYKDSVTGANQLASTGYCAGAAATTCDTEYEASGGTFTDTDISVGSRTFIVTADTSDAATDKRLTVGLDTGDIRWSDGVTSNISIVDSLPIAGNTLSY